MRYFNRAKLALPVKKGLLERVFPAIWRLTALSRGAEAGFAVTMLRSSTGVLINHCQPMDEAGELLAGIKHTIERIRVLGQRAAEIQIKGDDLQTRQAALIAEHEELMASKAALERETQQAVAEFDNLKAKVEALARSRDV